MDSHSSRIPSGAAALILAGAITLALSACGGSPASGATTSRPAAQPLKPASCPRVRPARSSRAEATALAPGRPAWTTFCIYGPHGVFARATYRGGPLDHALNGSVTRLPPRTACAAVARLPAVVELTYARSTRHVVLDMGGCPAVVMHNGHSRLLLDTAAGKVLRYYEMTVRHR